MNGVGTKQGQGFIYDRQEGLALTGSERPVGRYLKALDNEAKLRSAAAGKVAADDKEWQEAMKGLGDQEYWYQHENEIKGELTQVYQMATNLRAGGVADPLTGTDSGSRQFQEKYRKVQAMTQASRQLKEQYGTFEKAMGQQGDKTKFTAESIKNVQSYFQLPLSERLGNAVPQPMLMRQEPAWIQNEEDIKFTNDLFSRDGFDRTALTEGDINDIAGQTLNNPETARNTLGIIEGLSPEQLAALTEEAQSQGMSPAALVRKYQLAPYMKGKTEKWDFMEAVETFLPGVDTFVSENDEGTRSVKSKTAKRKMERSVINFLADPERVKKSYNGGYFGEKKPGASLEEMQEAGRRSLPSIFENQLNLGSEVNVTPASGGGGGAEENAAARIKWLKDLRSGDPDKVKEAAGYLMRGENDEGLVRFMASPNGGVGETGPALNDWNNISLTTVGTYKPDANSEPESFTRQEFLPISEMSDEDLLTMYDQQFQSSNKKKIPYGGQRTYKTPPGLVPSTSSPTTTGPASAGKGPDFLFQ